jgi:hypothetical protein
MVRATVFYSMLVVIHDGDSDHFDFSAGTVVAMICVSNLMPKGVNNFFRFS